MGREIGFEFIHDGIMRVGSEGEGEGEGERLQIRGEIGDVQLKVFDFWGEIGETISGTWICLCVG